MSHKHSEHDHRDASGAHASGPPYFNWVLIGFLTVAAYFLVMEHRAHVYGILPWLILAACPLMHLFMHRGHGGHGHGGGKGD